MHERSKVDQHSQENSKFKIPAAVNPCREFEIIGNFRLVNPKHSHSISIEKVSEYYDRVKSIPQDEKYESSLIIIDFLKAFKDAEIKNLGAYMLMLKSKNPSRTEKLHKVYKILVGYLEYVLE